MRGSQLAVANAALGLALMGAVARRSEAVYHSPDGATFRPVAPLPMTMRWISHKPPQQGFARSGRGVDTRRHNARRTKIRAMRRARR